MTAYNNNNDDDIYSAYFARYASKLEQHLTSNGVSCSDADMIIEESSVFYFEKIRSLEKSFRRFLKKQAPADVFIESACRAVGKHIPEATGTFCSQSEISKCVH